jgi:hypothetical protein
MEREKLPHRTVQLTTLATVLLAALLTAQAAV